MSKNKLAFFGWSKFGQEIYLYDSPTHEIKYVHEKVDGNLSEPLDGDELADSIYYDMSDAYQEIAKAYLMKNGKEVLKIRISDLDSTLREFCLNLSKTSEKGGRPQEYVYFLTSQGVARLIAPFLLQLFSDIFTKIA